MKLINCMELIDSKVDRIFARELPHEVGTLITSEDPSKNSVSDCMMKESKGDEDKATLPSSELSNGQIKQTETLNGVLPKECPNSKVPLEMSESKLSVPLEFSYSFSSSDENLSINKDLAENGIPIESSFDTEGNYVFSEDRTNSVFEFEDSEKFGLSDSEVDKLLKDVDGKEKSDSSKRTKTNEEKENGHTNEKEERNNEMVTATIDEGTTRKSTNLADMILNNFEEKLHSGHELQFSCLFPNDKDDKSLTSKSVNTNDNKIESTISNTSQSGLSEKEHSIDDKNKSSEHLTDNSLNSEVAQKSVTDETENTTEEISLNTAIKSEVDSKENCAKVKSGSDSSHSSSVPESNNEQSGMTQLDDSNHRAFSNEESEDILENTAKTDETQPHSEFLDMEVNNSEANETSDDVEMQNVSDVEMQNVSEQGVSDVEMQDDTSQLSSKSFDIDSQNKNGIPSTHVKKNVETVNLTQSSSNSEIFQIEPDTNSCQDLNAPNADNNSNSNERIINNQPKKMEVTETAASIPENTDIIEKKVEHLSNNNESTKSTSSNNTIAVETVNTQSQLIGTHTTSHSIPENTSSNNTANSIEVENSGVKTVFNNDSNDLKCTIDSGGSKSPLADPCIISNNETSTTSSDNAEDSVDIEIPLDEPGLVSNSEASASLDNAEESVGSEIQFVEPNTDSNNEASTSSGNAEDFVRSECPVIESQTDNDSESENNTVDCIEIESSVNKTDVNNESRNCSDSKNTVDSVGSEIPLAKADIVFNNESEASTSSDNAVDFVGSQNSLVEPDLIVDNKEADKVGQKRCFNLEENSEREAKRTRVEESRSNDSQSSSQCKTGNNSAVETNEQIDSSEIKEKKGSSESTSEISKLKIKDSDLLIKRSDVGKISNVTDRTNCSFELSKKDKILTKDCPIMPFGCKRVHEPGNIIEVKKVKFTPEMERHLSIINSSEKFQSKLLRRDIVSEVKKGEAKMGIKLDSKGTKDRLEGEVECKKSDNLTSAVISKNLTLDTSEKVLKTDKNEKLDTSPKDSEVEGKNISEKLEIKGNDEKPETEFSSKKLFSDTTIKKHNEEKSETTGGGEKCEIKSISEKMEITSSEKLESNNAFDKLLESKSVTETLQSEEAIKKFKTKDSLDKLESKDSEKVESKDPSEKYENKGASDNFRSIDVSEESESDVASEKSVDKSTSKKEENKDSSSKQSTTTREAESSVPPKSPKSNLDLAIERVALGLTDSDKEEEVEEEEDNSAVGSNPLPSVRNLRKNLLKNLSRFEWEELIMQKLTESISERSEVGDMRQRVQTQDQMLEYWRRKAQQLQKQLKDMEMVLKRYIGDARTRKDRPIPVKITRSVGLQVHMGPVNQGMVRNRPIGNNEPPRNQAQVRRRANRVSSPPVAGTMQQQQNQQQQNQHQQTSQNQSSQQPHHQQQQHSQQQQQQHQHHQQQQQTPQKQTTTVVGTSITSPLTVQKVVTAGYTKLTASTPQTIAPRPSITQATAQSQINRIQKIAPAPSPMKSVTRPGQSHTIISTAGSSTSTVSTVNSTAVNATNSLRIASAAQLNNRQPVKPTGSYTTPTKIIDLTDEEDRAKANNLRTVQTSVANSMITTNAVTSGVVPISSSSNIQTGSIRVVQPHQLTGTTTTTLLASPAPTTGNSRVAYFVPSTGVSVPQRQVLIASSAQQVRPGVMTVSSRQNQFSTLVLKNGAYVPLSQASGTQSVNTAILRSAPSMQSTQLQQVLPARPGQQIRVAPGIVTTVGRMPTPAITNVSTITNKHPAPLPNQPLYQPNNANWKCPPPKPELKISKGANKHQQGIVLSWNMTLTSEYDEIASYQLYAYQEGSAQPSTTLWKKVGDVKALPLPMACTLTQFMEGHKYHFAVRAVDVHMRVGPFSAPGNIVLTRK